MPEDISLIAGGFLAYKGAAELPMMMAVGFLGILAGDSLIFFAGRRIGSKVGQRGGFFARIVTPEKRAKVEQAFAKHGEKIVMIFRFVPGLRAVTYFTAGSAGMKYFRFIFWDGVAALASAPLFVFLGYYFGGQLEKAMEMAKEGQVVLLTVLAVGLGGYVLYKLSRRARNKPVTTGTAEVAGLNAGAPDVRAGFTGPSTASKAQRIS
jgi:membrane protein DedA with SNARE-associated domain